MGENFEIKHTRAERKQTRLIRKRACTRVNNDQAGIRECKISAKLARFERFDIAYSDDWRSVCHLDVACTGPGSTVMQNRDTNLESPDSIAIQRELGMVTVACRDAKSNRVESMFPAFHSSDANASIHPFLPSLSFFYPPRFIVPSLSDRSKYSLFIEERGREREVSLAAYATCPIRRAKIVKRGEKGAVEVDVGAGNAHAYGRRREILVTV